MKEKIRKLRKYVPIGSMIIFAALPIALAVHIIGIFSTRFADIFNTHVAVVFRAILAALTGWLPFSLAESIILFLPVALVVVIFGVIPKVAEDRVKSIRYVAVILSIIAYIYTIFVFTLGTGYQGSTITEKLGVTRRGISADEIYETAMALTETVNEQAKEIKFDRNGSSVMPYDISELNRKLNDAYIKTAEKYDFILPLRSHVKEVALSEPMTYTHISGVYTFFTGEANVNINFPDYTIAYTMAHEMSHQRGIAREDEANFMAYLVCMESDDPYIRYSGTQSLLEYVYSALSRADKELYRQCCSVLNGNVAGEMTAYNAFFEKYEKNVAATVSGTINNTYLTIQGTEGTRSYGLVADLAVICHSEGILKFDSEK